MFLSIMWLTITNFSYSDATFNKVLSTVAQCEVGIKKMDEQTTNLKLVEEVEKHPVLYNNALPGYARRHETEMAWNVVGKTVNMTASECRMRWGNIRAVFIGYMKLFLSGTETKIEEPFYLMESMQFTVPYIKALRVPSRNLSNPLKREEGEQSEEFNLKAVEQGFRNPVDKSFLEYFEAIRARTPSLSDRIKQDPKKEGLQMFLLSMLPDLLKMSDEQVRLFKRKALQTIDDILSNS